MGKNICFVIIWEKREEGSNIVPLRDIGQDDSGDLKYNDKGNFSLCKRSGLYLSWGQRHLHHCYIVVFAQWPGEPSAKTSMKLCYKTH